ncbi:hypothetical protein HYC85_015146 [Camellia sinensis]|uniref:Protein kinase domain-containing protein n=1 Tax=Camellia sinensis TaxID=4442 RepID=A0A7J7H8L1_CAMSI|nr:hypothetical protein HYC85_015146 [Camellia sinensis]
MMSNFNNKLREGGFGLVFQGTLSDGTEIAVKRLNVLVKKAEEERLIDIVDKGNDEMQLHSKKVVEMMRVAVWCLQSDFSKRPSMSVVVKVLEGFVDVDNNLDSNFVNLVIRRTIVDVGQQEDAIGTACTLLSPLALSGPRALQEPLNKL